MSVRWGSAPLHAAPSAINAEQQDCKSLGDLKLNLQMYVKQGTSQKLDIQLIKPVNAISGLVLLLLQMPQTPRDDPRRKLE